MRGRLAGRIAAVLVSAACALGTAACGPAGSIGAPRSTAPAVGKTAAPTTAAPTMAAPTPAAPTHAAPAPAAGTYLALGDSVPFGFRAGADYRDAAAFTGYPALVGERLGLRVVNATCPGETTASFLDASAQSNGCERTLASPFGYRTAYPLHVPYDSAGQSQLDFAVRTLTSTRDVRLVTVQLGANDAFVCQQTTSDECAAPAEQQQLAQRVQANLTRILSTLRDAGGYRGRIVVVTYYALDYAGATAVATQGLDAAIGRAARAGGALVASGFDAFRATALAAGGSSVAAGLVFPHDVHPTPSGQALLAGAVEAASS